DRTGCKRTARPAERMGKTRTDAKRSRPFPPQGRAISGQSRGKSASVFHPFSRPSAGVPRASQGVRVAGGRRAPWQYPAERTIAVRAKDALERTEADPR